MCKWKGGDLLARMARQNICLDEPLQKRLKRYAFKAGISMSDAIRRALELFLESKRKEGKP